MEGKAKVFVYAVDGEDRLTFFGPNWDAFAEENGSTSLGSESILGKSLFSFITDVETRHLYSLFLDKVRVKNESLVIPFRCDSPAVRRFMELEISPQPQLSVRFESRILREEPREPVLLLEADIKRSDDLLMLCSWCKQVKIEEYWMEIEDAVERLALFDQPEQPRISHACCERCARRFHET